MLCPMDAAVDAAPCVMDVGSLVSHGTPSEGVVEYLFDLPGTVPLPVESVETAAESCQLSRA